MQIVRRHLFGPQTANIRLHGSVAAMEHRGKPEPSRGSIPIPGHLFCSGLFRGNSFDGKLLAKVYSILYPISADYELNENNISSAYLRIAISALCLELLPAFRAEWPGLHFAIVARGSALNTGRGVRA